MLEQNVAEGVHRVQDSYVNWYLVEDDAHVTAVDAGMPSSWDTLLDALLAIGRTTSELEAVVLTHAHFDHVGFAERARAELGIPVWVHEADVPVTRHPLRYKHERSRLPYFVRPRAMPIQASLVRHGMLWTKPIKEVRTYRDGETLDVPGSPRAVLTPGHTFGHCALHLPERDALIAGDAVVTLDPYTAARGPRIVARAATADSRLALASLDRVAGTGAGTVLTGHGEPWRQGAAEIVLQARAAGVS